MAKIRTVRVVKTKYGTYALHFTNYLGRRRRLSVGSNYQSAERLRIRFESLLLDGKDPERETFKQVQREKVQSITIKEFYPMFMKVHGQLQSESMQRRYKYCLKNVCRSKISNTPMGLISKPMMHDYMLSRMEDDGVAPATVNREAAFVKIMLSVAVQRNYLNQSPLQGLKLLKESGKRNVCLTVQEARDLLNELTPSLADIVEFAIYTGIRKENILSLKIDQIKFHDLSETGQIQLKIKGGTWEIFPLGSQAVNILKRAIRDREEGYVFINPKTGTRYINIARSFTKAVKKLKLKVGDSDLRFHDLRHVFCTWLSNEGVSRDILQILLGHKDRKTTDRYTTLSPLTAGKLLEKLPNIRENVARIGKVNV